MSSGIYKITLCGRFYIGSASNLSKRWSQHRRELERSKHAARFMQNVYNKHGCSDLAFDIIEFVDSQKLIEREQFWLDALQPFSPRGYNTCRIAGSTRGRALSAEHKAKVSAALVGIKRGPPSELTKAKLSVALAGKKRKPCAEDTKRKISAANRGRAPSSRALLASSLLRKGTFHEDVTKQKISDGLRAYWALRHATKAKSERAA